ncbi:TonB-dependent siderophore receptor [Rubrivivax gelatinosus]|uniref:TonB-dependent siderophore receptor n=1 Tax=Rubrivivax gelatinosus TaxID=28068 RepID=UPI00190354B8|nr:TonB-dependent siderophore receptor [Rubrivivax gelatinosus]MBK1614290.1 TonB-dependent siderophore receptor [Rubrivivax gelatinosus]
MVSRRHPRSTARRERAPSGLAAVFVPTPLVRALMLSSLLLGAAGARAQAVETDSSGTAAAPAEAGSLPALVVRTAREAGPSTEASGSFASGSATLFKGTQELRDIPQPVTVLTREYLDQRGLVDLQDVLRNTPGVTVDYTDSERVTFFSRGYQIDALQIDGLTLSQSGAYFIQPDAAILDRVEVLRGASGTLRGSGNPSATVNLVRKRPTRDFQGSARVTLGSWDRTRVEADVSGALVESGAIRGRVVAVSDDKEFFQKARHEDKKVVYGVFEADLGTRTTATLSLQYTQLEATGAWGNLPSDLDGSSLDLPRSTYLGAAWNQWNRVNQQTQFGIEHRLDGDWTLRLDAAHTRLRMTGDEGFKQSYFTRASNADPYLFNVTTSVYSGDQSDQDVVSLSADGPFELFGRRHELVLGAEVQRVDAIGTEGYYNLSPITGVDIRDWNPYTSYAEPSGTAGGTYYKGADTVTAQKGVYARTRLSVTDPLNLLLGARISWWDYDVRGSSAADYKAEREITPFVGATYDITRELGAYASYTEIYTPQNVSDADGDLLQPIRGEDYELGLKGSLLDKRLNAQLSLFRISNKGKAMDDTSGPNPCPGATSGYCKMAGGLSRSKGWEVELAGELAPGWMLQASYTQTRTRYVADSSASNVGQPLRSIDPRHLVNVFSSYRLGGVLQGLTLGGGLQARSDSYVSSGALTARQGGYAVYNAMLSYAINPGWTAQVNVNNVFDKVYYAKFAPTGISNYYGDPRNVNLSLRANF